MAINGFETETGPLTEQEKKMVPIIIKGLWQRYDEHNAVTSAYICKKMKEAGHKLDAPRLRKIINFLRIDGIVPDLVATSKGYYRTKDKAKLAEYIESIEQRAGAIGAVAQAMRKHLSTL